MPALSSSPAIEAEGLHKRYRSTIAVDDVSVSIGAGEIFGLLGRNGAGKTTTVELIAGLRRPDRGAVRVLGLDPRRDRARIRQVLGVQLQDSHLHAALTVAEMVGLYRSFYPAPLDAAELIESVGLTESRRVRFEKLSGGQQQRLSIALALVGRPRVVILDELTTGLDPQARRQMWATVESLRDSGVTVLLVSHAMEEVERLCDRVALLDAGRVVALDTPAGLVGRVGFAQRVTFRATEPVPGGLLESIDGVEQVRVDGDTVVVEGHGDLLQAVSVGLVRAGVVAVGTRSEQATLDDAFLALTGRRLDNEEETTR
ncbi:ABC-2 type transport system ATP-binding protein [Nonomuraea thailandensis]|uniref:ABC-2 type transport system ATP-binding protein n=1 Tax=Nonomuraea thailandensis TaxID=1188745 RepID=A0A9X2GF47_9ACTN|nr:ABC transporter ATP-binding protein [Nonomuraea thailandensis]MCP2356540.1 ABC-2 type transport system ATP-binding protein [Nonomuraea thailandensis]